MHAIFKVVTKDKCLKEATKSWSRQWSKEIMLLAGPRTSAQYKFGCKSGRYTVQREMTHAYIQLPSLCNMQGHQLHWNDGENSLQAVDIVRHFNIFLSLWLGIYIPSVADQNRFTLETEGVVHCQQPLFCKVRRNCRNHWKWLSLVLTEKTSVPTIGKLLNF